MKPTWITLAQAARRFGVSRTTLYRLIAAGTVARVKRTGDPKIYISAEDLEEATTLRPTREAWVKEWRRLAEHRARAEEALLQHLRDTTKKRDRQWLKRHSQLRQRLKKATDLVAAYLFESEEDLGRRK